MNDDEVKMPGDGVSRAMAPGLTSDVGQGEGNLGSWIVDMSRAQLDLANPKDEAVRLLSDELGNRHLDRFRRPLSRCEGSRLPHWGPCCTLCFSTHCLNTTQS
jgi:hypothetical protein